jgi:hypothetical protein
MAATVFSVVGEHRNEPHRLLLLGDDGLLYAFVANLPQPTAVRSTDEWQLDPVPSERRFWPDRATDEV